MSVSKEMFLFQSWKRVTQYLGEGFPSDLVFNQLMSMYDDPRRHYHNINHIYRSLILARERSPQTPELVLAIWFHDCCHTCGTNGVDEKNSAKFAANTIEKFCIDVNCSQVIDLILSSDHNRGANPEESSLTKPGKDLENFFLDIDLSILGSDPSDYAEYTKAIRLEYEEFNLKSVDKTVLLARKEFLRSMLGRDHIFKTGVFRINFEKQARENVFNEITEIDEYLQKKDTD